MRRNHLFILLFLIVLTGLIIYASYAGFWQRKAQTPVAEIPEKSQAAPKHQGHAQPGEMQKTQQEATVEQTAEVPTVEIPLDKQQLIGVRIVEVAERPLQKVIRTAGRIEYDERKLATVNARVEGWIEKLYIDYSGKQVRKGEPLVEIYSPELMATQQEFLNALKWSRQGKEVTDNGFSTMLSKDAAAVLEAVKQRLRLWNISEEQIKRIEESGKPLRTLTLYSPVSGYIIQKMAVQGMRVMPGEKLFDVADLSTLWVITDMYEYELPLIDTGQKASINLSNFPGKEIISSVDYIYPTLSGETRTAKVRFSIPNPGGLIKPQMFTTVEVKINLGRRLAVPDDAVIDTGTRQVVYVDRGEGYFEPRQVMTGIRAEGFREILKGLKSGEKVAASATFLIDAEAQLKNVTPLSGHKH